MPNNEASRIDLNLNVRKRTEIKEVFLGNCVLYFPSNRFEEPAWLNERNLTFKTDHMEVNRLVDHTNRRIINPSPLREVQKWLFDLIYDRAAFEIQTQQFHDLPLMSSDNAQVPTSFRLPIFTGFEGSATNAYEVALEIIRTTLRLDNTGRLGIGRRTNRTVSVIQGEQVIAPNVFQLSSGEVALLDQFLSILRDFDLSHGSFSKAEDIRGIVVVDEIDLHLHATHQYEILPRLIAMFPRVQFLITSHSPLFALGLKEALGDDGFALYRLPQGEQIDAEEFGEFEHAYRAFTRTITFLGDIRSAIASSQGPVLFVDGEIDVKYLKRAAEVLEYEGIFDHLEIREGGGDANLKKIWKAYSTLMSHDVVPSKIILLHDCDSDVQPADDRKLFKRKIPRVEKNPIEKGIENMFSAETLQRALEYKSAFVDIIPTYTRIERGKKVEEPEKWAINENEKANLCRWICDSGVRVDFECFVKVFDLLYEIPDLAPASNGDDAK